MCSKELPLEHWRTGVDRKFNKCGKPIKNDNKGFPDLLICFAGLMIGAECKSKNGKPTEHQLAVKERFERSGAMYIVVRSVTDLCASLQEIVLHTLPIEIADPFVRELGRVLELIQSKHKKYFPVDQLPPSASEVDSDNVVELDRWRKSR